MNSTFVRTTSYNHLISFLVRLYHKAPFFYILIIGCFVRTLVSFYNYTPIAEDEYSNILKPAILLLKEGQPISLINYRLEIFPMFFYFIMKIALLLGVEQNYQLISISFFILGLLSLFFIYGMYKLGKNFLNEKWSLSLAWLASLHFILPFYATRPLQSSMCLIPLVFAYYFLTKKDLNNKDILYSSLFFGLACIIRFQIGILYIFNIIYILIYYRKDKYKIIACILGGILTLLLLSILDITFNKPPLSTLISYIQYNFNHNIAHYNYGHQPWFTYILILMLVFIPPFSLSFLLAFFKGSRNNILLVSQFLIFILVHSLIQNKLERFIIPIIPLFFLLTWCGLAIVYSKKNKWILYSYKLFWGVNFVFLILVCFSRSQNNIIEPALYLNNKKGELVLYKIELWKSIYRENLEPTSSIGNLHQLNNMSLSKRFFLLSMSPWKNSKVLPNIHCQFEQQFQPSLLEHLIIKVNPKMNSRRNTTYLYQCTK